MQCMKLLLVLVAAAGFAQAQDFDVLITNGRIVDGTGNPSWIGDVAIREGKVAGDRAAAGADGAADHRRDGTHRRARFHRYP